MRLLIVSHTPHYGPAREPAGLEATVREIDCMSTLFESVCHVAPLHAGDRTVDSRVYGASNVRLRAVHPAGGATVLDKAKILTRYPSYVQAIREELTRADAVHVRCPANIALCALAVLKTASWRGPTWIKYAGSWAGYAGEPLTYWAQRAWLRSGWSHASVTTNGAWPNQPAHVFSLCNPCLTDGELDAARDSASTKRMAAPLRVLFVGRLDADKGVPHVLRILHQLDGLGLAFEAELAGDGPSRAQYEGECESLGLAGKVRFLGWLPRAELNAAYRRAHLIVLPSRAEGWPKVLSEAMAHGVVPIASNVGSIPQYLSAFETGACLDPADWRGFAAAAAGYANDPSRWQQESGNAARAAAQFSYSAYLDALKRLLFAGRGAAN